MCSTVLAVQKKDDGDASERMHLKLSRSREIAGGVIQLKCAFNRGQHNGLPPTRGFGGRPLVGWLFHQKITVLDVADAATGVLEAVVVANGTAMPAATEPTMPSVTRGEMMARLMRMIPPWHSCRLQAFAWRVPRPQTYHH